MSLEVIVENIPNPLKKYNQWIGWVFEEKDGKKTKVPKNLKNGYNASSKNPDHWESFNTCLRHMNKFEGIGFVTSKNDPFVIWDLDECVNIHTGVISKKARKIIEQVNSYTEFSPSGKGIRIIVKAKIGPFGRRNNSQKIEVYDGHQYLTITGHHVKGTPTKIRKRREITNALHEEIFAKQISNAIKNKKNLGKYLAYKFPGTAIFSPKDN